MTDVIITNDIRYILETTRQYRQQSQSHTVCFLKPVDTLVFCGFLYDPVSTHSDEDAGKHLEPVTEAVFYTYTTAGIVTDVLSCPY